MVDCAKAAGDGCNGGDSDLALDYIAEVGLVYERDYPYVLNYNIIFRLLLMVYAKLTKVKCSFLPDKIMASMKMLLNKEFQIILSQ